MFGMLRSNFLLTLRLPAAWPEGLFGVPASFAAADLLQEPAALLRSGKRSLRHRRRCEADVSDFQGIRLDLIKAHLCFGAFASDLDGPSLAGLPSVPCRL